MRHSTRRRPVQCCCPAPRPCHGAWRRPLRGLPPCPGAEAHVGRLRTNRASGPGVRIGLEWPTGKPRYSHLLRGTRSNRWSRRRCTVDRLRVRREAALRVASEGIFDRFDRNQFDTGSNRERLNLLARANPELVANVLGNDDLVLRRYGNNGHMSYSLSIGYL